MGLNKVSQEEMEKLEEDYVAALFANTYINLYEQINLIGNQPYGKPRLPEEDCCLRECSNKR